MRRSRLLLALAALLGASAAAAGPLSADLAGRLVRLEDGRLRPVPPPAPSAAIAVYVGASWCAPCRAFLPELKRAYPQLQAAGVEVVFLSDDAGCAAMRDYAVREAMPWPVIACRARPRFTRLARDRGAALPGLLLYNREGALVRSSWSVSGASRPAALLSELLRPAEDR